MGWYTDLLAHTSNSLWSILSKSSKIFVATLVQEQIREAVKFSENNEEDRVPRKGKTISGFEEVSRKKAKTVNLFENIQKQLFSLLDERHKILQIVSQKINTELAVIQQTVAFLQQLLNLKFDQGIR